MFYGLKRFIFAIILNKKKKECNCNIFQYTIERFECRKDTKVSLFFTFFTSQIFYYINVIILLLDGYSSVVKIDLFIVNDKIICHLSKSCNNWNVTTLLSLKDIYLNYILSDHSSLNYESIAQNKINISTLFILEIIFKWV